MVVVDGFLGLGPEELGQRDDVAYLNLPPVGKGDRRTMPPVEAREALWERLLDAYGRLLAAGGGGPIYSLHPPGNLNGMAQAVRLVGSFAYPGRIRVVEVPESHLFAAYLARLFAALAKKERDARVVEGRVRRLAGEAVALIRDGNRWRTVRWVGAVGIKERAARQTLQTEVDKGRALIAAWRGEGGKREKRSREFLAPVAGGLPLRGFASPDSFGYLGRDYLEVFCYPRI